MDEASDESAERRRAGLMEELAAQGRPADPAWRAAFARVPRHVFVPVFWHARHDEGPGRGRGAADELELLRADDADPARRARWLRTAYDDCALVTRMIGGRAVSSSSQPSLMAMMLDELRVEDGMRVLEVGTGTGYNAALLAERLGDERVVSVDVEEEITGPARSRLAAAGYGPTVVTGDGARGWAAGAPYDRVIATCAMPGLPGAWLEQCVVGAEVLAPVLNGLVRVRVRGAGRAEGRFLPTAAFFVGLRGGEGLDLSSVRDARGVRGVERALGQGRGPARERFGLSVEGERQWVWLDSPEDVRVRLR